MSMKNLLIIGARGFGREVYNLALACEGYQKDYVVKGFLDDKSDALDGFKGYPPIVSSVEDYEVQPDDVFICALGALFYKKKYAEIILEKGGKFISLIHPSVIIGLNTKIGVGSIVLSYSSISCDILIGDFVTIHGNVVLGHDVNIGSWCVIESGVFCGGGVCIGESTTMHTKASIHPRKTVGINASVSMGSVVIRNVPDGATVFGNPAKRIFSPKES